MLSFRDTAEQERERHMRYDTGPQAKVTTVEEFLKRGGGGGGEPPQEPGTVEKKIRDWAGKLIRREEKALADSGQQTPRLYLENRKKIKDLNEQFRRVADPGLEGTMEAVKILWRYGFGLRTMQPS